MWPENNGPDVDGPWKIREVDYTGLWTRYRGPLTRIVFLSIVNTRE